ncbi:MAG: sugar phosphate isomerase/epimerase [Spirochaetes bacterium]|nr:sugar phosphate isomerase/epimerase [Spirochaetota bacterium]
MLSLSLNWLKKEPIVRDDIRMVKEMGFNRVELHWYYPQEYLAALKRDLENENVRTPSIHNPLSFRGCDVNVDLAHKDRRVREASIKVTKKTIEAAVFLGAEYVVLHVGNIDFSDFEEDKDLVFELYRKENRITPPLEKLRTKFIQYRQDHAPVHLKFSKQSLEELLTFAGSRGIKLGIESRYYPHEIPSLEEIKEIIEYFNDPFIGFWHDVGHTTVQERLGFYTTGEHLATLHPYIFGFHLHDIKENLRDHLAPGQGGFDFYTLKEYVKKGRPLVLEVFHATKKEVLDGRILLEKILGL